MNRLEKSWILYDAGNSAFILPVSTAIPICFKNLASAGGGKRSFRCLREHGNMISFDMFGKFTALK